MARKHKPRSKGCVTHAAKQLALPPNQKGYLMGGASIFFFTDDIFPSALLLASLVVGKSIIYRR